MDSCAKHPHERGVALCRRCGESWCNDCLIYSFGPAKPPFCMSCAMFAGGVRTAATRPALPKRQLKALHKAAKAETKRAAKDVRRPPGREPESGGVAAAAPVEGAEHGRATADWETPWWEDRPATYSDRQPTYAD